MSMASERSKVWYGAMAFWVAIAVLLAARILLLDTQTLKSYMASPSHGPASIAAMAANAAPERAGLR